MKSGFLPLKHLQADRNGAHSPEFCGKGWVKKFQDESPRKYLESHFLSEKMHRVAMTIPRVSAVSLLVTKVRGWDVDLCLKEAVWVCAQEHNDDFLLFVMSACVVIPLRYLTVEAVSLKGLSLVSLQVCNHSNMGGVGPVFQVLKAFTWSSY